MHSACYCAECMKTVQVRNVPDELHRRLKARAALEGRSLSEMLLAELIRVAERPTLQELVDRVAQHEAVPEGESAAEAVRAERER